jgi:hypothetical protein
LRVRLSSLASCPFFTQSCHATFPPPGFVDVGSFAIHKLPSKVTALFSA